MRAEFLLYIYSLGGDAEVSEVILELNDLRTHFFTDSGEIPAVDGVSLSIHKGERVGIVGESGCGKSVTSLSVMQLVPDPPGRIVGGDILFKGENIVSASNKRMKQIRGNEIAMIFQEPMTSLDPLFTIGNQIIEGIRFHKKINKKEARNRAIEMLELVGIPGADKVMNDYPHQLSGGMRQRVMIAISMACNPELLIADEPTTALDVTIQAQILDLMRNINEEKDTAMMLITHDLGVVAEICDRVIVMYAGQIIEEGTTREILKSPNHPYTKGLIRSLPDMKQKNQQLYSIPGTVPKPKMGRVGCRFAPRCEFAFDRCFQENPELYQLQNKHKSRCFLNDKTEGGVVANAENTVRS